jgi:hypothetical protein
LTCHLQIDADPVLDPAYHFDADSDPDFLFDAGQVFYLLLMWIKVRYQNNADLDPDSQHCVERH